MIQGGVKQEMNLTLRQKISAWHERRKLVELAAFVYADVSFSTLAVESQSH